MRLLLLLLFSFVCLFVCLFPVCLSVRLYLCNCYDCYCLLVHLFVRLCGYSMLFLIVMIVVCFFLSCVVCSCLRSFVCVCVCFLFNSLCLLFVFVFLSFVVCCLFDFYFWPKSWQLKTSEFYVFCGFPCFFFLTLWATLATMT